MRTVIKMLCSWRGLMPAELADILGRSQDSIQAFYLRPMVRHGKLHLTIPENPTHRQQAYWTVQDGRAK